MYDNYCGPIYTITTKPNVIDINHENETMARKTTEFTLGEAIRQMLQDTKLDYQLAAHRVLNHWEDVVGPAVARQTEWVRYRDGAFLVKAKNSVWSYELQYARQELQQRINQSAGFEVARQVTVI